MVQLLPHLIDQCTVDFKILVKILATLLNSGIRCLIQGDQVGFMPRCQASDIGCITLLIETAKQVAFL